MSSVDFERGRRSRIRDDLDALRYSRGYNDRLKRLSPVYGFAPTRVSMVADNFFIDDRLEIAVARAAKVRERAPESAVDRVYSGGVVHENLHAVMFPVMVRAREVMSLIVHYLSLRVGEVQRGLVSYVENIVSDVVNEVYAWRLRVPGYRELFTVRRWYVQPSGMPLEEAERVNPLAALFDLHYSVFTELDKGREPAVEGSLRSHAAYRLVVRSAALFDPVEHLSRVNLFTESVTKPLLQSGLYDFADEAFKVLSPVQPDAEAVERLAERVEGYGVLGPYALHFALTTTYYRLGGRVCTRIANVDSLTVPVPSPGEAAEAVERITSNEYFLDPETLDRAASTLLRRSLTVKGSIIVRRARTGTVYAPFYRNPRGRINPLSLARARRGFLDWEVEEEAEYSVYEQVEGVADAPNHATVVLDVSGSTMAPSGLLAHVVGHDVPVLDAERAIALALVKPVMRLNPRAATDVFLFSDSVNRISGTVAEVHDTLLDYRRLPLELGNTWIEAGVEAAVARHRDGPRNPFVLITDLEVSDAEAERVYRMLLTLKRSPVLVVVVGERLLSLARLNSLSNSAAVAVNTVWDVEKLEKAIGKVSSAVVK